MVSKFQADLPRFKSFKGLFIDDNLDNVPLESTSLERQGIWARREAPRTKPDGGDEAKGYLEQGGSRARLTGGKIRDISGPPLRAEQMRQG